MNRLSDQEGHYEAKILYDVLDTQMNEVINSLFIEVMTTLEDQLITALQAQSAMCNITQVSLFCFSTLTPHHLLWAQCDGLKELQIRKCIEIVL